jgi:hypothetical protein
LPRPPAGHAVEKVDLENFNSEIRSSYQCRRP